MVAYRCADLFERDTLLDEILTASTELDARVTSELVKNIFFVKAPLHDGAMVISKARIHFAGCVLPLTQNTNLSKDLGTRHRAGIGMSEQSDAVVVIVSEETGTVSVAIDGTLKRHLDDATLDKLLRSQLIEEENEAPKHGLMDFVKGIFKSRD